MPAGGMIEFCPAGAPVTAALAAQIAAAQDGDLLAPVDVVVPGGLAGVTLRRAVAGPRGLANVRFSTLPQLAERLAARRLALASGPLRRPLLGADRAAAVRAVLAAAAPSTLVLAARRQRATAQLVESVLAELDAAGVDAAGVDDAAPLGLSAAGTEIVALHRAYRARVPDLLTRPELIAEAAAAVEAGQAPATHVIVLAHGRYPNGEKALLASLRAAERLSVVVADDVPDDTAEAMGELFDVPVPAAALPQPDGPADLVASRVLVVAPDAEEEVRLAVRTVLAHLARTGCRPERIAVAHASSDPYTRLLAEQLVVAGIPHHVPGRRTLAQTVVGRTLQGALVLHARGYPRPDVLRWLADAPVLDGAGRRTPSARWDRISREAGVSRGLATWRSRLEQRAADQRARGRELAAAADAADEAPDEAAADAADEAAARRAGYETRAAEAEALLEQVEQVAAAIAPALAATTWDEVAGALGALLVRVLGPRRAVDSWSARADAELAGRIRIEQQAYDTVAAAVADLASLAAAGVPVNPGAIVDAVDDCLAVAVPSGTTLGRGVGVGAIRAFAGADLDLLLVLGATEGALPARQRENPLLRDADRRLLSAALPTVASRRADARAHWVAALASARVVHVSYPRADTRAQRRQFASPWYLEIATRLAGETVSAARVEAAAVDAGAPVSWLRAHDSFDASLRRAGTFASAHELDVALSLRGRVGELAATDARLARGLAAATARARGEFDEWTGHTGPLPAALRAEVDARLSASALEKYATCPASHFYGYVLSVRDLEDRGGADTIDARDRGTLLHGVLEELIREHLPGDGRSPLSPDRAWSRADLVRAAELLDAHAKALTARGLTGREVLWTAQLAKLHRALTRTLIRDGELRREARSWPVSVEAAFGRQGADPLLVDLPTQGQVPFAGYIDRVDATEGGGLLVVDYKTGRGSSAYERIPRRAKATADGDLVDGGRRLQLVLYALAARAMHGVPGAATESLFWFIETGEFRGGPVTAVQQGQLTAALDVTVGGVRGGIYPVNPGAESWRAGRTTWDSCAYCAYDLLCPTSRAEQWNGLRRHVAVRPYADLVDPPERVDGVATGTEVAR